MNRKKFEKNKKCNWLYLTIIFIWCLIVAFNVWFFIIYQWENIYVSKSYIVSGIFVIINFIILTILYCNTFKDFIFVIWYYFKTKHIPKSNKYNLFNEFKTNPKVIMLYTTCNDFDENSLLKSSLQDYNNFSVYILDDSSEKEYIDKINKFIQDHNQFKVVRRINREGFKAGNINSFLLNNKELEYDYFVLLDSDEIIPSDFISKCLKYFDDKTVGIVQANHKGSRSENHFDSLGSYGIISAWTTFISNKNRYGTVTLNGHGAMISKKCYEKSGGFPYIVAEDLGFTIKALENGYKTVFADDVICEEMFPIDYLAFKKRNIKWTQGNYEFFKKIGRKIWFLKINFFKKLDLWMSTTSLSLTVLSIFLCLINFSILYPLGFYYKYLPWMIIFLIIFLFSQFINDLIYWSKKINPIKLLIYIFFCYILYTSMIVSSIQTLILAIFGKKAKFIITPKTNKKYSILEALKYNKNEIIVATILIILAVIILLFVPNYKILGIIWIILLIIPLYGTVFLTLLSNIKIRKKQSKEIKKIIKKLEASHKNKYYTHKNYD